MQNVPLPASSPNGWASLLPYAVAILVAVLTNIDRIPKAIKSWRNRRREQHLADAQSTKTLAEADSVKVGNLNSASDFMLVWMQKATEFKLTIDELEAEMKRLKVEADKVPRLEEGNKLLAEQNEQMNHILKLNGIKYDGSEKSVSVER